MRTTIRKSKLERLTPYQQLKRELAAKREEFELLVVKYIVGCPDMTHQQIADKLGIERTHVANIATRHGVHRPRGRSKPEVW